MNNCFPCIAFTPISARSVTYDNLTLDDVLGGTVINFKYTNTGILKIRTANQCLQDAMNRPIPNKLFGVLWYEGELTILFADTNTGKSILAMQIADAISKGHAIGGFYNEAPQQPVLFFDFELTDKQIENRYSLDFKEHYIFHDNFYRIELNPEAIVPKEISVDDAISNAIEKAIIDTNTKVLIVDNITYLRSQQETAKDALPLMQQLKQLKNKYNLSILVLAHTPKRDSSRPITLNDLAGSKMLANFCDGAFAIGASCNDKGVRYIKQLKARNTEIIYDSDNVAICQVSKPYNFLQFEFIGFGKEVDHLRQQSESDKEQRLNEIISLKEQGISNVEIGRRLGVSEGAIRKQLKKVS